MTGVDCSNNKESKPSERGAHTRYIPLGGWSKDKSANRLALILFVTTDDSALFKAVVKKIFSIRKKTRVRGKIIN